MHPMINIAIRAARRAGNVMLRAMDRIDTLRVEEKGRHDYVSEVDRQAEREIVHTIRRAYPQHAILGEEGGGQGKGDIRWIIDPLDGTTNFLHGIPHFAVSIAVEIKGRLAHGVIYDPVKNELFTASAGSGAQLNERRIRVSARPTLDGALLGTGIPFREDQSIDTYLATLRALIPNTAGIRRPGSAALDLAYVACGRFDAFWEFGLHDWDLAAGVLLVQEAGGIVSDFGGGDGYRKRGNVLCANPRLHERMLRILRQVLPPEQQR